MSSSLPAHVLPHPLHIQPTHSLIRLPQLRCLVDVDLARLLRVRLAELLANPSALEPPQEDPPLAGEVGRAVQPEIAGQDELIRVQKVPVRVVARSSAFPFQSTLRLFGFEGSVLTGGARSSNDAKSLSSRFGATVRTLGSGVPTRIVSRAGAGVARIGRGCCVFAFGDLGFCTRTVGALLV